MNICNKGVNMQNNVIQFEQKPSLFLESEFLRARDIAKIFSVSPATVTGWIKNKYLKVYKIGKTKLFKKEEVLNLPSVLGS